LADVDILEPSDRRRIWIASEKAALLAEIDAEGGKVRLVARRHGISESLLYTPVSPPILHHTTTQTRQKLRKMVPRGGIEPPTLRFSVACSTN
jgi:transposase-like protein